MQEPMSLDMALAVLRQFPIAFWGGTFFWPYRKAKAGALLVSALEIIYPAPWVVGYLESGGFTGQAVTVAMPKEETC